MIVNQILQGDQKQWRLIELLAEGDAGEVFLVESVLEQKAAILKRPHSGGFTNDIVRQANQITAEASILKVLSGLYLPLGEYNLKINELLDQNLPGTELSEQFFIVVEKAPGISLTALSRIARIGEGDASTSWELTGIKNLTWLKEISTEGKLPDLLLLRIINALYVLLPAIHSRQGTWFGEDIHGVLWNDIKFDHIFWDPAHACLTILDWGNGQFLERDGVSRDRRFSTADDYQQFIEEVGRFLSDAAPQLHQQLEWPASISPDQANQEELRPLHENCLTLLRRETAKLLEARQHEIFLLSAGSASIQKLNELSEAQKRLYSYAELPDISAASRLINRTSVILASSQNLSEFKQVCDHARKVSPEDFKRWNLLEQIAELATSSDGPAGKHFRDALRAGVNGDWIAANWSLFLAANIGREGVTWKNFSNQIRSIVPEIAAETPSPHVALSRMLQMLEDELSRLQSRARVVADTGNDETSLRLTEHVPAFETLLSRLKKEIHSQWTDLDPMPPACDLSYNAIKGILEELQEILPKLGIDPDIRLGAVRRALSQPAAQADILLDAWVAKGFKTARRGLHQLLLWDPERRRVLRADTLIELAPAWIEEVRNGPQPGEKLKEYAIRMEYTGRELRSRVGKAAWIESPLWLFSELRAGSKPGDLVTKNNELIVDYPWINRYKLQTPSKREPAALYTKDQSRLSRTAPSRDGKLGAGQDLYLLEPLDTWIPEAHGSSARVFAGLLSQSTDQPYQAALKIMRPDKASYALPLFFEEVQILSILRDVPGVVQALECGFILLEGFEKLSSESPLMNIGALTGDVVRYSLEEANQYLAELADRNASGWLPYIALAKVNQAECLLLACDEGYTKGQYLQVESAVQIATRICEILQIAHEREIVYRDHKILHYYWDPVARNVSVIDWNVAKLYTGGLSEAEMLFDLVQLGARGLHHLFTGRPAPGALPVGPTRPEEVEMAPHSYATAWTYDDKQRLSQEIRDILAGLLSGGYSSAAQLREDFLLQASYPKT
jgi:serine/threonine protein kinase